MISAWRTAAARCGRHCSTFAALASSPFARGDGCAYLWLDATDVKVREAGRIVPVAVTIAVGVNSDGRREVQGMAIGASESETFWLVDAVRRPSAR
jgi:hypothetical protein